MAVTIAVSEKLAAAGLPNLRSVIGASLHQGASPRLMNICSLPELMLTLMDAPTVTPDTATAILVELY
jgi:hypothetical protein